MSHSELCPWLIVYDIANRRRLGRVHRYLRQHAIPVQYSVFVLYGNDRKLKHVLEAIEERIDRGKDDVRAYHLPQRCELVMLGTQNLPQGILLPTPGLAKLLHDALIPIGTVATVKEFGSSEEEVIDDT